MKSVNFHTKKSHTNHSLVSAKPALSSKLMLSILLSAALALFAVPAFAATQVGTFLLEDGNATLIRGADIIEVELESAVPVFESDVVKTDADGFGTVLLGGEDGDEFTLDEDTTFVIDEYTLAPDGGKTVGVVGLLGGKVRSVVNTARGKKDIKLRTSSATIGVKGTDFLTEVPNNDVTRVTTFHGKVSMASRLDETLKAVDISSGFSSMVVGASAPSSPFSLSRESLIETASIVGVSSNSSSSRTAGSDIVSGSSTNGFGKSQFDAIVERAALKAGALVKVQIKFPSGN